MLRFLPKTDLPQKASTTSTMAPKKRPTADEETTSKGKSIATAGGIVPPSKLNLSPILGETVSTSSQEAAENIHRLLTYET